MSPKTGRPKSENPKSNRITVRIDDETMKTLNEYCLKENVEKAEAIRRGIKKIGQKIKNREFVR